MPLKRCVAKENYLIALLRNSARNNFCLYQDPDSLQRNSCHCRFLPLDGAAVILSSHLPMSSFPDKFGSEQYLFSRKKFFFLLFSINSNSIFFYLCKFITYQIIVCHNPNCGNMYFNCSNVWEVASGLLTPRGQHNGTEIQFLENLNQSATCLYFNQSSSVKY